MHFLGYQHPREQDLVATLLKAQRPDGSWEAYYDAPQGDINGTVECYAALRCVGMSADDEPLVRARRWIFEHGGLRGIRVFTRYWLALLGEWPWSATPNLPPEVIANPRLVGSTSTTSRAGRAQRCCRSRCCRRAAPCGPCRPSAGSTSCFPTAATSMDYRLPRRSSWLSWRRLFLVSDRLCISTSSSASHPVREMAINACLGWIVRHQDADGAWGGIQPPWIYSLMALNVEGYSSAHPVMPKGLAALDSHWSYERGGTLHIQASESPVWDTLLAVARDAGLRARVHAGHGRKRSIGCSPTRCATTAIGRRRCRGVEPSGWAFERANLHYPDIDDTAVALIVLARLPRALLDQPRIRAVIDRALGWTLAMQSSERRLGRVRQGQRSPDHHEDSVLRLRRSARPAVGRRHGTRARSAGLARLRSPPSGRRARLSASSAPSRRPTAAGSAAGASTTSTARPPCCLRSRPSART